MKQISGNARYEIGGLLFTKFPQEASSLGLELREFVIVFCGLKSFCAFVVASK